MPPLRPAFLSLAFLGTAALGFAAEDTQPSTAPVTAPSAIALQPANPAQVVSPPRRERIVSPRVAAMLATATPKFVAAESAPANEPAARLRVDNDEGSAATIVRLPTVIVHERRLPTVEEVDRRVVERRAMEKYLGPEDGFDRGFLNLITSKQFPLLALFGSVSNEERAMARYNEEKRRETIKDLMEMAAFSKHMGDIKGAEKIVHEVKQVLGNP